MEAPIRQLKGVNGQAELFEDKIVIRRKGVLGFMLQGIKGEKTIYFESIVSIKFKKPSLLTNGYIQFGVLGGIENRGGIFNATKDEDTVMFKNKSTEDAVFIKDYIENRRRDKSHSNSGSNHGVADELKKLKELLDNEVITQSDFDNQKKKLLN